MELYQACADSKKEARGEGPGQPDVSCLDPQRVGFIGSSLKDGQVVMLGYSGAEADSHHIAMTQPNGSNDLQETGHALKTRLQCCVKAICQIDVTNVTRQCLQKW